ncbi:transcription antiterminator BglG [Ligilactobacillus pabuli]|uniref:Transcription antiterminator BglG n=1 Tax=Ligilactobacillus pabuli TaxID=2886039 RepID=A0ABQ5JIN7_9LACO|nr:sigma-54-dependent transcriptional regulator [Ligilactobacillus pabuli]GKS81763.1 transcription antiterminator BglG [Ligilactobacillus pabuli]
MTRREKILAYLHRQPTANDDGVTTLEVTEALGLVRSNVSKELNALVRENILVKSTGRPVRYCFKDVAAPKVRQTKPQNQTAKQPTTQTSSQTGTGQAEIETDFFETMIGRNESLKNQVEQAKAAILYPPHGLNVLITGPTGSGKTYFANAMYQFACDKKVLTHEGITVFNCADYAHNPQLLMSQLFGYTKGAFTGANEDKEGLIQQADGGMLFLDEVHRLPPEGQEMIFYFMDHGTYNRLGESGKTHHANVRLVCATTEDPESSLLQTFVRRIPIMIQMPAFKKRTMRERLAMLKQLLTMEANRIHRDIKLNEDVVQALIGSVTYGNVGQLKSNIQLVCAQGFLGSINNETEIKLVFDAMPANIKEGLPRIASNRSEQSELTKMLEPTLVIHPDNSTRSPADQDNYELPYNLYEVIGEKAQVLQDEGLDQGAINNFIMTDINVHLKSFYKNAKFDRDVNNFNEIIDQDIIDVTNEIGNFLQEERYDVGENYLYGMSLHISSFIKRVQSGKPLRRVAQNIVSMVADYPREFSLSQKIKVMLEEHYQMPVPDSELYYLAILLASLKAEPNLGKVGIVVAAHGNSTASSMVHVVQQLLSADNLASFDMALEMDPQTALKGIAQQVKQMDQGNGVLLMVDMGSLGTFTNKLVEMTGVEVKTIDMVTTAMVLEAARKSALIDSDLEMVYQELSDFNGYSRPFQPVEKPTDNLVIGDSRQRAIVALCATGQGTAAKIKEMLDEVLVDHLIDDIVVIPISVVNMGQTLEDLKRNYHIIATTGVTRPKIPVPFISLKDLLQGGGEKFITLIEDMETSGAPAQTKDHLDNAEGLTEQKAQQYLGQYFTFINPQKLIGILWRYCDYVDEQVDFKLTNALRISVVMHLAGAIERYLTQSPITATKEEVVSVQDTPLQQVILQANQIIESALNLTLTDEEVYYIVKLFDTETAE